MKIDKLSGSKVKFEVIVGKEVFSKGIDASFEKMQPNVELKGFRKGSVPKSMFIKKYGVESLYEEAVNYSIQETYFETIADNKIKAVAQPKIDLAFEKVTTEGFTYTAEVAIAPVVTLGEYKGLGIKKEEITVTDAQVQLEIEKLLKDKVSLAEKAGDTLENGDVSIIDFDGYTDGVAFDGGKGESFELQIGSNSFIPGFEDQMIGMKKGETKDINVTFPEVYHSDKLKGKDAKFVVTLHEIKTKQVPELTTELIEELKIEGVTTKEELEKSTKERIQTALNKQTEDQFIDQLVEKAASNSTMEIAPELVEVEKNKFLDNTKQQAKQYNMDIDMFLAVAMGGKKMEDYLVELEEQAKKKIRFTYTLETIAETEKMEATDKDLEAKYAEFSKQYNMDVVQIETMLPRHIISNDILIEKAIKFLQENN